ncbi:hypothetical protein C8D88_116114 [Lentzea atacamensis]|uniref:Uncharacterized protein n=1 Tax=Lentzea atacamensis TaxID=531938 RepID=A0A316HMC1_9PSEU|nr:hypothetical protein [Lentzea atacamensis]PWK81703.1 hypothetical protein C8D88_116114 [Lentzea atacamensis]
MTDIIARIDAVTGCQQCGKPLGPSPSDDFCGEGCQHAWHVKRAQEPAFRTVDSARLLEIRLHTQPPEVEPAAVPTAYASGGVVWDAVAARTGFGLEPWQERWLLERGLLRREDS